MTSGTYEAHVTDDGRRLLAQMAELQMRVLTGGLSVASVRRGLQHLITGEPVASCTVSPLFVPLAHQIANVEAWNAEFSWGFTPEDFARCALDARSFNWPGDPLQTIVLVPSLFTVHATFAALAKIAVRTYPGGLTLWPYNVTADTETGGVWLMDGIKFKARTLEWRLLDLGTHLQPKPHVDDSPLPHARDLVGPENAAHAEVMAAAAHFPGWLKAIMGGRAPHVRIPGYRFRESTPRSPEVSYGTITYGGGMGRTTLYVTSGDTVWSGEAVATTYPVPLGDNVM